MKKLYLIILLFIFTGCTRQSSHINTIIINEDNIKASINYPITNTKLDYIIKKDLQDIYNKYKNDKLELNIDYLYNKVNNMISIVLFIYKNNGIKENYVKTYFYKDKISNINAFLDINLLNKILLDYDITLSNNYEFYFDTKYLYIYFNEINNYRTIKIPLNKLNIKFEQNKKVINEILLPSNNINYKDKVIALTFDDGPSIYTDEIIELLHENNCKATFFVLGNKVNNYSDVIKKSLKYGNEIGNHSYNHKWLIKLNENEIKEQINKTQNIIYENTGYLPKYLRPTYGSINSKIRLSSNLDIVLWNVDTLDWKYRSYKSIYKRATKNLKDGNIILMHDIYKRNYDALNLILPTIKKNGYRCVTISELKEIEKLRKIYE